MKYKLTNMKLRRLVAAFVGGGGGAIEIFSGRQTHDQTVYLGKLAADFELPVSAGSDFHRTLDYGPTLGVDVERLPIKSGLWSEP